MAQRRSTRLEKQHLDAMEDMVERGLADNESEAHRMLLTDGMRQYGYKNGGLETDSGLANAFGTVGWIFAIVAFTWLGTTFFWPINLRMPALGFALASVLAFGLERVLREYDGDLRWLAGGEKA